MAIVGQNAHGWFVEAKIFDYERNEDGSPLIRQIKLDDGSTVWASLSAEDEEVDRVSDQ